MDRAASRNELLRTPTASLDRIRKRWAAEHALSAAEWDVVAEYVLIGSEEERQEPPLRWPEVPSHGSYLDLLDAFHAVYEQRSQPVSPHGWTYFGHLHGLENNGQFSDSDTDRQQQAVLDRIAEQRAGLEDDTTWQSPGNLGRCLLLAIRDEGVDGATLNRVLGPFWPTLWGLAARGHWIQHDRQPVRGVGSRDSDVRHQIRLPGAMTAGAFTISFASVDRAELAVSIDFGPQRRFGLTLRQYPEFVEFHAMLNGVKDQPWNGRHVSTAVMTEAGATTFSVTFHASAMRIDLPEPEWHALRRLVQQAWERPEISRWLAELQLEYGEQG